ncbi:MAG TPA: NAD(P)-dependent oxidoreductase [Xanthobacteraceae bacterium]|nr:NAD(P)-dependent oxidoreductase [Xanthobacteraceae bacterium]
MDHQVALIGVGNMGSALLERLVAAGAKVRAFDIKESAMQAARERGAQTVASSADAARGAKIVHVFVHNDQEIFDATLGDKGVLAGAEKGATVILHSTILPATTRRVAEEAARRGVRVVDACVTSTPRYVRAGEAVFLVGGDDAVVAEIRPHLETIGSKVWHFGPLGCGNAAKLVKNLSNVMERVMWMEALTAVKAAGIDPRQYAEMLKSVMRGSAIADWEKIIRIENGEIAPTRPGGGIFRKDVPHALTFVHELGLKLPLAEGTGEASARFVAEARKRPEAAE